MLYAYSTALSTQGQQHLRRCALSCARTHACSLTRARDRRPTDPAGDTEKRGGGGVRTCVRTWHACVRASRYIVSRACESNRQTDRRMDVRARFEKSIVIVIPPYRLYARLLFSRCKVQSPSSSRHVLRYSATHFASSRIIHRRAAPFPARACPFGTAR